MPFGFLKKCSKFSVNIACTMASFVHYKHSYNYSNTASMSSLGANLVSKQKVWQQHMLWVKYQVLQIKSLVSIGNMVQKGVQS